MLLSLANAFFHLVGSAFGHDAGQLFGGCWRCVHEPEKYKKNVKTALLKNCFAARFAQ
jgi:hypothetical protein